MDQQLHMQVVAKAGGQIHRVNHHLQLCMAPHQLEIQGAELQGVEKEKWEKVSLISERILRSFLITGNIWESEKLVTATLH